MGREVLPFLGGKGKRSAIFSTGRRVLSGGKRGTQSGTRRKEKGTSFLLPFKRKKQQKKERTPTCDKKYSPGEGGLSKKERRIGIHA